MEIKHFAGVSTVEPFWKALQFLPNLRSRDSAEIETKRARLTSDPFCARRGAQRESHMRILTYCPARRERGYGLALRWVVNWKFRYDGVAMRTNSPERVSPTISGEVSLLVYQLHRHVAQ